MLLCQCILRLLSHAYNAEAFLVFSFAASRARSPRGLWEDRSVVSFFVWLFASQSVIGTEQRATIGNYSVYSRTAPSGEGQAKGSGTGYRSFQSNTGDRYSGTCYLAWVDCGLSLFLFQLCEFITTSPIARRSAIIHHGTYDHRLSHAIPRRVHPLCSHLNVERSSK